MILKDNFQDEKLKSFHEGTMVQGLGIGCDLDNHLVFKTGQLNMMLGIDNVGKTFFKCWYYVCLAIKHGKKFTIYSSENEVWSLKMKIMSFYSGKHLKKMNDTEYYQTKTWMEGHFTFVDDSKFYKFTDLIKIFEDCDSDCVLIDPYNSLSPPSGDRYSYNMEMLGLGKQFCKKTGKTLEINGHAGTEASRRFHKDGEFNGLIMPPEKSHIDGGQIFANRCDDFYIIHRYFRSPWDLVTFVYVDKVKETETGGKRTLSGEPLMLDFKEFGFSINRKNPLKEAPEISEREKDAFKADGGMPSSMETYMDPKKEAPELPF